MQNFFFFNLNFAFKDEWFSIILWLLYPEIISQIQNPLKD